LADREDDELVAVAEAANEGEAAIIVGRLETAGIRAISNPGTGAQAWGKDAWVRRTVLVRAEDAAAARELLGEGS
jgi:hypothetical protein